MDEEGQVEVNLDEIDLDQISKIYKRVQAIFVEEGFAPDAEGFTRIVLVFKGFADQMAEKMDTCPSCLTEQVMHVLGENFDLVDGKERFH